MKNRMLLIFLFCTVFFIVLSSCSNSDSKSNEQNKEESKAAETKKDTTEIPEAPSTPEEIIKAGDGEITKGIFKPGKVFYEGNKHKELYKEAAKERNSAISDWPQDLTTNQIFNRITYILAQDYGPHYKKIKNYEVDFDFTLPDGTPITEYSVDEAVEKLTKPQHVVLLLDSSGSMGAKVPGGQKMDLAKKALQTFSSNLPKNAKVTLRVFGHKGTGSESDKKKSCQSSKTFYKLKSFDDTQFEKSLSKFQPSGWTPLALAINKGKKDLKKASNSKTSENLVFIVSDGIETCGGDPVKAAKSLYNSNMEAIVNIIGFDVNDEGQQQLKSVAEAGGGDYKTVQTKDELQKNIGNWYDWGNWAIGASTSNNFDFVAAVRDLLDIQQEYQYLRDQELELMNSTVTYLSEEEIITNEQSQELYERIRNRTTAVRKHLKKLVDEKERSANEKHDKYEKIINRLKE